MKLIQTTLIGLALVGAVAFGPSAFTQGEGDQGSAAPAPSSSTARGPDIEEIIETAMNSGGLLPIKDDDREYVEKVLEGYRNQSGSTLEFSEVEFSWISQGLHPSTLEEDSLRNVYDGRSFIPTPSDKYLLYYEPGSSRGDTPKVLRSKDRLAAVGSNVGPYLSGVEEGSFWLSVPASETAVDVDAMFNFIMWVCYFFGGLIAGLMLLFVVKYRRRPGVRANQAITHHTPLEIFWSVVPTILVAIMFWGGYDTFLDLKTSPPDAMRIDCEGGQWDWSYTYPSGATAKAEIHVPANTPIEFVLRSRDVLHSFHVPNFRVKSDVLPNRYTRVWFDSGEPGIYPISCTEYCGTSHSGMYTLLVVEPREDFEAWLDTKQSLTTDEFGVALKPEQIGERTYQAYCAVCHSSDGSVGTGPSFLGLFGKERRFDPRLSRESDPVTADENYIRESILQPSQRVVQGFGNNMAPWGGKLEEVQITGLIRYLEGLAEDEGARDKGNDPWLK